MMTSAQLAPMRTDFAGLSMLHSTKKSSPLSWTHRWNWTITEK